MGDRTGAGADNFTKKYILPYIKVSKYCSRYFNKGKCTNVNRTGASQAYYNGAMSKDGYGETAQFILPDGTFASVSVYTLSPTLVVDLNGDKGPNKLGKDVFGFRYGAYYYYPYTDFIYNRFIPNARNNVCTETNKGDYADGCTWKIMRNGWKIPDDYPW